MKLIIEAFLGIIKTGADCYIIWIIGPDGILFDLISILKIIGSGISLLLAFLSLSWKYAKEM